MINSFEIEFNRTQTNNKPAFMPFLVAGDPDYQTSLDLFRAIAPYASMLEIGFPYSDPLADGPTIQAADERALKAGMNTDKVFSLIKDIRTFYEGPISVLVYANLVYQFGLQKFYKKAAEVGIDGVLVPDVPLEEAEPFVEEAKKNGIFPIFMITQTTNNDRLRMILGYAEGYLYLVSVLGVTGSRNTIGKDTLDFIKRVKKITDIPLALGFGISTKEHIANAAQAGIDGVIVGSAIIKLIEQNLQNPAVAKEKVVEYIKGLTV